MAGGRILAVPGTFGAGERPDWMGTGVVRALEREGVPARGALRRGRRERALVVQFGLDPP